jgi:hypothetical protein
MGQPLRDHVARAEFSAVFESDKRLGTPDRVRLVKHRSGDPLPIE